MLLGVCKLKNVRYNKLIKMSEIQITDNTKRWKECGAPEIIYCLLESKIIQLRWKTV
jgi:hypothetical protein